VNFQRALRIDQSFLCASYPEVAPDGVAATFHADGQLATLVRRRGGAPVYTLELDGLGGGRATMHAGSGGSADWEVYSEGAAERFDAWSDNSRPVPTDYLAWVRSWLARIESPRAR
jgi:hypothetical protein